MANKQEKLKSYLSKYKYADIAKRDILGLFFRYTDLRPKHDLFTFNDGSRQKLVNLEGTIPVTYRDNVFNIPICIHILDTYPYNAPIVYVKPASSMEIKQGTNVDSNGMVNVPYLRDWRYPHSDLLGLIQILVIAFSEDPPVFTRSASGETNRHDSNIPKAMSSAVEDKLKRNYKYADITERDIKVLLSMYKDLRPTQGPPIYIDGSQKELINLDGTIPVSYEDNVYNIPICIHILDTHPYNAPIVYVKPTSLMVIKQGTNVDSNGMVYVPYLRDWRYPQSDLPGLVHILEIEFSEKPPVFARTST